MGPHVNTVMTATVGSILSGSCCDTPQQERTTVEDEANILLSQIEQAHGYLDTLMSVGQTPSQARDSVPVSAAIGIGRDRMGALNDRLSEISRSFGRL